VGPFKSPEEKAAKHKRHAPEKSAKEARRAEEKAAKEARRAAGKATRKAWRSEKLQLLRAEIEARQAQRAQKQFERSPIGLATAAHERGDALFQTSMPVDASTSQTLSTIEAIGWHLEHSEHTSVASSYTTTDLDGDVTSYADEELVGVYLFRRS